MSDAIFNLDAKIRTDLGKGASRRLRHADLVPAIVYGGEEAPLSITLVHNKVMQALDFEAFYSHVLTLNIEGKATEVLLKDVQRHPYKPKVTHMDFQRVVAGHQVHTSVPLHFINEATAAAVKAGGVAEHHVNEVEITCLPKDLPEFIEVDMANIELGQTLHLSDLTLPAGVSSVELAKGDDSHDLAVVTVKPPKGGAAEAEEDAAGE
ncbi:50S ribosomal protein L25/general stress protein Ctc [Aestuariibacter sp. GS-14]|jgi:large subunit ribosomal protein L25|uniref:50S ribosomal protein L25/general stress protein Ctc n=1 Tax=Alteromonadaceae TaxID=72275 RepID=UPI001129D688|nr:50S ribosomal protein L25/general stress protein Ctc [Aestuariibacter sp. GS-14]TPV60647.1 50S ribosomal protein L25/general stress protein Ctc [Aestuariibacter sp. GS-14]